MNSHTVLQHGEDVALHELTTIAVADAISILVDAFAEDLQTSGRDLDARVLDITREIGRGVVREVLRRASDDLVEQGKKRGLVTQRSPMVRCHSIFGPVDVQSGWRVASTRSTPPGSAGSTATTS